jgi:hypothetical protein
MKLHHFSLSENIKKARNYLLEKSTLKPVLFVAGLLATIWFLIRVIPKPSRAGYPCMKAAAPLMSGFVLYMLAFTSSFVAFKKSRSLFKNKSYVTAMLLVVAGLFSAGVFFVLHNQQIVFAKPAVMVEPPDGANNPMGEGQGIIPGKVIWAWNSEATNPACDNKPGNSFWDYKNNDTLVIRGMVEESMLELTGTTSLKAAWDSIFTVYNRKNNLGNRGYLPTEKIFIKINQGTASWLLTAQEKANGFAIQQSGTVQPSWRASYYAAAETGPFVVLNILRQLVNVAGVPQENIYVGDPMSHIYDHNYQAWNNEFPKVKYADKTTENFNRTFIIDALNPTMEYSDKGIRIPEKTERYFEEMEAVNYMINVACLKAHVRAGITLCAKNHFGSITRSGAGHLHTGLVSTSNNGLDQSNTGYKKYRVQVDIMGHKYLGGKTMLFIVEGLYGGGAVETKPGRKWKMAPFNGNWTSSVFMSVDQVALESVCYDFLRTEFNGVNQPENYPNWVGVDDYLHQAADKANWPEGITYNPDGKGELKSLGVHEHWNDAVNKQYSRNLGMNKGIELKQISGKVVSAPQIPLNSDLSLNTYPNPFRDRLTVSFKLNNPAEINLAVYNLEGRMVKTLKNEFMQTGNHEVLWSLAGNELTPGTYFIRLTGKNGSQNFNESQKIQFIK